MTHIIIEHTETDREIKVYFQEPIENAHQYVLAEFQISTAFTRDMAALVAAEYSHRNGIPIDHASLSQNMRDHLRCVEKQYGLIVTYRMNLGPVIATAE